MEIRLLDKETIDKIAAGEVIERPSSVVKELLENAIDAGATAITVEIEGGGIDLIRVTDNGCGIEKEQVRNAFCSHATSKIRSAADLDTVASLGFRGEALSSIAAVAQVELITKTREALLGVRYVIEGAKEQTLEEIGAPDGSTFLVRNLFYNTPARRKFLKTAKTEAGYIESLMERIALSQPSVSFRFIHNGQLRLQTSGNALPKDIIYHIYGKEIASSLIEIHAKSQGMSVRGYIGKPVVTRGNRNYENYFVNGRYVKSNLIAKGIEDAYRSYLMQHQYPFTVLSFEVDGKEVDVNVHPQKLELRFSNSEEIYRFVLGALSEGLREKEMIPSAMPEEAEKPKDAAPLPRERSAEPFETRRLYALKEAVRKDSPYEPKYERTQLQREPEDRKPEERKPEERTLEEGKPVQQELPFFSEEAKKEYRILGQVFSTYWLVEMGDKLFLIDQHAAHEKVIFERLMKRKAVNEKTSQQISPPLLLSLSMPEEETLKSWLSEFQSLGFEISHFGGREYMITAIPADIYGLDEKQLFIEMLDDLVETGRLQDTDTLYLKIATMSCKAAIKGGDRISTAEFQALFDEMLTLDNPYHCPHGRPTTIQMSRYELERKFKRVI